MRRTLLLTVLLTFLVALGMTAAPGCAYMNETRRGAIIGATAGGAASSLIELTGTLSRHDDSNLLFVGHTDAVGSSEHHQTLPERRAGAAPQKDAGH
jgi:hypothetical protein